MFDCFTGIQCRCFIWYDGHYGSYALRCSSVPAHVEMMGFLGIGNNPMVGCTVACAVDVAQALAK